MKKHLLRWIVPLAAVLGAWGGCAGDLESNDATGGGGAGSLAIGAGAGATTSGGHVGSTGSGARPALRPQAPRGGPLC